VIGSRTPAPDGPERSPVMLAPPPRAELVFGASIACLW